MSNIVEQFRQAIQASGLQAPDVIHDDGAIHRFSTNGKPTHKNGWYVLHMDATPAGAFGDWRSALQSTWCAKSNNAMTPAESEANRQRMKTMAAQRDADRLATQLQASETALKLWNAAKPCTEHPYLTAKGVKGYGVRVDAEGFLRVPMRDTAGRLWNVERINPADFKDKRGLYGGRRTGLFHTIGGKPVDKLIICEGYATGASIHQATGWPVAVAFNAGNLEPVAVALHKAYPALTLVIGADDDHLTSGNTGMTSAKQAALAVGGFAVSPQFPAGKPDKATDFNDLAALAGLGAVGACFSEIEGLSCKHY